MRLSALVEASDRVRATRSRLAKVAALADLLRSAASDEIGVAVDFLSGRPTQGKLGAGWAAIAQMRQACPPAPESSLELLQVDRRLGELAAESGPGSTARRRERLGALLSQATTAEQDFLLRLLLGEMRQGALEAIVVEAIAAATDIDPAAVRRAVMLSGSAAEVARAARDDGAAAVSRFGLSLMVPVQPMLAQPSDDVDDAIAELGESSLEYKLDGARVQIHKDGDRVQVYSRKLNTVTPAVPEIVELVAALPARAAIFDGEAIALRPDGSPHPFQITMRRFGRRLDVPAMRAEIPLSVRLFDCLRLDDDTLIDEPMSRRFDALAGAVPAEHLVPRVVPATMDEAQAFIDCAFVDGHEGVMAKSLTAPYEAGKRGKGWRKLKPTHTLDLVVLAVEWGSGRREGYLSNLHLGARDPATGGFVMLGKTFKGMTDALLAWQTQALLAREIGREGHVVHVRPELVVEIAFNNVQASPHYPGGLALRFARVKRYRDDKDASQADTIDTVRGIFTAERGSG